MEIFLRLVSCFATTHFITNLPKRELTPLQKRLNAMTLEEQIQYLFYSKERDDDDDTMDNPT